MEYYLVIDEFFKSKKLSSYAIAKETGFSSPTIGRWRDGTSMPSRNNLKALCGHYPELKDKLSIGNGSSDNKNQINNFENEKLLIDHDVNKILSSCSPLHISNYIHLNWDEFKDQPLIKFIQKEAVSVYKSEQEKDDIKEMVIDALQKYLGKK